VEEMRKRGEMNLLLLRKLEIFLRNVKLKLRSKL
jgi:hypothetical protein